MASRRFNMFLLTAFAAVALLLALAGIYGVQAYTVGRRTSEIGVRVAMGATHTLIIKQIVRQGMAPAVVGLNLDKPKNHFPIGIEDHVTNTSLPINEII